MKLFQEDHSQNAVFQLPQLFLPALSAVSDLLNEVLR